VERRRTLVLLAALAAATAASLLLGRYPGPVLSSPAAILADDLAVNLVVNLRLPRILAALLLGTVLAAAGFVFQTLFRNPLVDSGFLGVSQGAAFGASLAIIFAAGRPLMIQVGAAFFAFLGLGLSYTLAHRIRFGGPVLRLLLAGIAVGSLYTAGTGLLKYLADPQRQLPDITFWILGGLWSITWPDLLHMLPVALPALLVMWAMRWRLNLLALRDETAFSLGAAPRVERVLLLTAAVAATAAVVAKAGQITWVGLIIPHLARRLVGWNARLALPASLVLGALFVLLCDDLARTLLSGEIPLGILTALLGSAAFLVLLTRRRPGIRA
jgi:iron complex transport system permease protein